MVQSTQQLSPFTVPYAGLGLAACRTLCDGSSDNAGVSETESVQVFCLACPTTTLYTLERGQSASCAALLWCTQHWYCGTADSGLQPAVTRTRWSQPEYYTGVLGYWLLEKRGTM